MEWKWLWVVLVAFLLGGWCECEGCWDQEKTALLQLKPFFTHIDDVKNYWVEGKQSSDCCEWGRVECDNSTGRVIRLFLNLTTTEASQDLVHTIYPTNSDAEYKWRIETERHNWYLNTSLFLPFEELKNLYLSGNSIAGCVDSQGIKKLSKLNKLKTLDLRGNLLGNNILSNLEDFTSLESLRLQDCGLEGTVDMLKFNDLKNLKELYLGDNEIESLGSLFQSEGQLRLMKLEVLGLSYNQFNNSILSSLAAFSNLKSLYISENKLKGAISIQELNALSNLVELDMSYNKVTDFVPSPDNENELKLMNLEVLDLRWNLFNGGILSSLGRLSNLKFFSLKGENLEGSIDLGGLHALRNLEELYMSCFFFGACSFPLQSLDLFPQLKTLSLVGFSIYGTLTTQSPLHLKNLESLSIYRTSLENNFLKKIGGAPSLRHLELWDCGLNGTLHAQGFCELTNLQELHIGKNNLKGNLPECFSNLTSLESLDLSSNQFFGNISTLKSLTSLEILDLSSNQFSGNISVLKSLTSLESLDLSSNNFEIPSSLGPLLNLSKLQDINADNNTIYAEAEMHSLTPTFQLNFISLSCCGDVGPFPQFLYHQHDLQYVDLSNIKLIGEFPNWLLENNLNLETLILANNSLRGYFELTFLSHKDLSQLDISKNSFYGNIPNEIGAKLPSLQYLSMSENQFGGSIPDSIGDMNSLQVLILFNNKMTGGVPDHLAMGCSSLTALILSNNNLQGQMFSSNFNLIYLRELKLDGNHFSGRIPDCLRNCSLLSTLDLSNNELFGGIPKWMGNMLSLEEIIMANNHLEGLIPMEFCQLNHNLKLLDLSVNNISGSLPSCFSPLWITQVHLSRNKLQGPLTNAFHNSTNLVTLDLSYNHLNGSLPNWIDKLCHLSYLLLNNNHFEDAIPNQLCKLGHLSLIDLSNNNFSGTIPPCLKITTPNNISQTYVRIKDFNDSFSHTYFTEEQIMFTTKSISYPYKGRIYLSGIDLSCNKLTGEIPHEVKNFQKIVVLNLSHNSLTGPIPSVISDLKQIESLDLSYNKLSGKIPSQLVGLNFLSYFSVAYNNLSGSTPERTAQFATFEENSYLGNPFLCGAPLPNDCSTDGPSSSLMPKALTDNGSIDMNVFSVSFVVSYIMVLLSIASVLYINPYWRQAWFYHIEACITSCYYFVLDNIQPK